MKISVISPIKHSGTTMVSLFLGQALAVTQGVNVMLTYSGMSRRICEYASVSALEDKTCSISQVVKLMEARAISPEDLFDYSLGVCTNLHIMDTADPTLTEEDGTKLMTYVFDNIPSDVTICDVSGEIFDETTQQIFSTSDIVVIVIQPDTHSYEMLRKWKESEFWPKKKDVMVVVNRYDEEIAALREISKRIGVAHVNVCKLHYSPYITKYANSRDSLTIVPFAVQKDPRVIELNNDLKEMCQYVISSMEGRFKWEV